MNQALRLSPRSFVSCLASWLGISALLISPALAQVNGPGPSPANLFDIVLNLPGDEAVVTSASFESIGGVLGQTTQLNVNDGGTLDSTIYARFGSEVNIGGGTVDNIHVLSGSEVNISGGTVGRGFTASSGSVVNISGGTVYSGFETFTGSDVEVIGGEFRLNGADFSGGTITLVYNDLLTGTLADGSAFIFGNIFGDNVFTAVLGVTLTVAPLPTANLSPTAVDNPIVSGPSGLRAGQTLTLQAGGSLRDNFAVVDATLNVEGGIVGDSANASNSVVNISGGTVGEFFRAFSGSVVNISRGTVGEFFRAFSGSEVNISGGTFGDGFEARSGSVVNILGSAFFIDGLELDTLVPGQAFTITDRDVTFSGLLADGEQFSFHLNSAISIGNDSFDPEATLTVTLGSPVILGDVNLDGVVNFLDISAFIGILSTEGFQAEADIDQNEVVNFLDVAPFIEILLGN